MSSITPWKPFLIKFFPFNDGRVSLLWNTFCSGVHLPLHNLSSPLLPFLHVFKLESHFWSSWWHRRFWLFWFFFCFFFPLRKVRPLPCLKFKHDWRAKWQILGGDEPKPGVAVISSNRMLGWNFFFDGRNFNKVPLGSSEIGERTAVISARFNMFHLPRAPHARLRLTWFVPSSSFVLQVEFTACASKERSQIFFFPTLF